MSILAEYRWYFLIGAEIVFWISAIGFFLLRYGFRLRKASFIAGIVLLLNEVFILVLGVMDYYETGKFSNFQIITLVILLYALFYGKKDLKKLDIRVQKLVARWRNEPLTHIEEPLEQLTGWAYTKQEIGEWSLHLVLFIVVHIVFFFMYGFVPIEQWGNWLEKGIVLNEAANRVSQVWGIVFLVDTVITFSYVFFPKKEKKLLS
ncbi:hypothetical protein [Bacillus pseudomycoides]|uniref:hypothetical protein n=1 Tax=Bacillus pseudomycoides TaxID=64104 RepID=UPI000BEC16F4|nr:hypothetical protein [Bacillus pseudomycoides]MED4651483.1 hypothetical protein [Bacillus pseudomycoides]PEE07632.1 hypothetical protein CON86_03500 [Bacillus pseudomycoides]PEM74266.1 hypothetical protein CN632_19045 [Bacillus pseudomycoides]PHC89750.1 hypothetical protein COF63_01960 [Bacillus pseudomycoides]